MRRMRLYQIVLLALFFAMLLFSVIFWFLNLFRITFALLLVSFPLALIIAVYGSLAIREEEEES